jgi:predicted AlkP superfamily pyrophosphatase or phosphodiesterase
MLVTSMPRVIPHLLAILVTCVPLMLAHDARAQATQRVVVMISVDGLANFYLDDPRAEIPTIRRLAAEGVRAAAMTPSMPTVTWPNHTTLVTGVTPAKHGVLGNSVLDRATRELVPLVVDPVFSKDEIVRVPTIYDLAKKAGKKTAALLWPATRGATTLDWTVPDVGSLAHVKQFTTPALIEEFTAAGIPWDKQEEWWNTERIRERDRMFAQMGALVLRRHRPDLMLLHFVELDHAQHRTGPQSPEAYAALKNQDDCIAEFFGELQRTCPGAASLLIVSDHGFLPYRQRIMPNVLLRQQEMLTALGSRITGGSVRAVAQGGSCFIYVLDEANRSELVARLVKLFGEVEGVSHVLSSPDFAGQGLPDPAKNPQMADIVLSAKSGYNFNDLAAGEQVVGPPMPAAKGAHGSDANHPEMQAAFIAWGIGIKAGARLGTISNTSVAPTLAALLGIEMRDTDGAALETILQKK